MDAISNLCGTIAPLVGGVGTHPLMTGRTQDLSRNASVENWVSVMMSAQDTAALTRCFFWISASGDEESELQQHTQF